MPNNWQMHFNCDVQFSVHKYKKKTEQEMSLENGNRPHHTYLQNRQQIG